MERMQPLTDALFYVLLALRQPKSMDMALYRKYRN